jgi:hypothetical protein
MIELLKARAFFVLPSEREGSGIALWKQCYWPPFVTVDYPNNRR